MSMSYEVYDDALRIAAVVLAGQTRLLVEAVTSKRSGGHISTPGVFRDLTPR